MGFLEGSVRGNCTWLIVYIRQNTVQSSAGEQNTSSCTMNKNGAFKSLLLSFLILNLVLFCFRDIRRIASGELSRELTDIAEARLQFFHYRTEDVQEVRNVFNSDNTRQLVINLLLDQGIQCNCHVFLTCKNWSVLSATPNLVDLGRKNAAGDLRKFWRIPQNKFLGKNTPKIKLAFSTKCWVEGVVGNLGEAKIQYKALLVRSIITGDDLHMGKLSKIVISNRQRWRK